MEAGLENGESINSDHVPVQPMQPCPQGISIHHRCVILSVFDCERGKDSWNQLKPLVWFLVLLCCWCIDRVVKASNYDISEGPRFDFHAAGSLSKVNIKFIVNLTAHSSAKLQHLVPCLVICSQFRLHEMSIQLAAYIDNNGICQDFSKNKRAENVEHVTLMFITWYPATTTLSMTLINKHS